jgi:hypothetical protein
MRKPEISKAGIKQRTAGWFDPVPDSRKDDSASFLRNRQRAYRA